MSKLNIDNFVIDDVFDKLKHLEHTVSMKKSKKKRSKHKGTNYSDENKMIINISV